MDGWMDDASLDLNERFVRTRGVREKEGVDDDDDGE